MFAILFVLLIVVPIAELWLIVEVGSRLGLLPTLVLLIGMSVVGASLLKREGTATWARLRAAIAQGQVPAKEVTDGALILFGGALLLTPGFLTDAVGFLLVLPPTRALVKGTFRRFVAGRAIKRMGPMGYAGSRVYSTTATRKRAENAATPPRTALSSPSVPSPRPRSAEDDSPDKG